MTEPTDDELTAIYKAANGEDTGKAQPLTTQRIFRAMRAAIAKWGTPAPVGVEPVAYLHDDGYWTAAKNDAGRRLNDRLLFAGSPKVAVYTAPQPTQAQAGAVPLTCEWTHDENDGFWESACGEAWQFNDGGPAGNNVRFCQGCGKPLGIKGGQHGTE